MKKIIIGTSEPLIFLMTLNKKRGVKMLKVKTIGGWTLNQCRKHLGIKQNEAEKQNNKKRHEPER